MKLRVPLLVWLIVQALPCALSAEVRALLIGVSDYVEDELGFDDLAGPANDVRLMSSQIARRGVTDIVTLGGDDGTMPTRAAIAAAFETLIDRTTPGDFIYVHLSGHGTQVRDVSGDEADGLDEVFLPADATRSTDGTVATTNGIADEELGDWVRQLRAAGADVWIVIDACHSGSGLRGAGQQLVPRYVPPEVLGLPPVSGSGANTPLHDAGEDLPGGLIAFYAARPSELAFEASFGTGDGEDVYYGLFTAAIAARLGTGAEMTFRQLFTSVMSDFNVAQTPSWEGELIDAPVFGQSGPDGEVRFPISGDELLAGQLHGFAEGDVLALYAEAFDPRDASLGFVQVEDPSATTAYLRPVGADCEPDRTSPCAGAGQIDPNARFAALHVRSPDISIGLALPTNLALDDPIVTDLRDSLAAMGGRFEVTDAGPAVRTFWEAGQLWFNAQPERFGRGVGLGWAPGDGALPDLLERIASAERLASVLASVSGEGFLMSPAPLTFVPTVRASNAADLNPPGAHSDIRAECRRAVAAVRGEPPEPLSNRAELKQCDQVQMRAEATIAGEWDVNLISIDAQYCVSVEFQRVDGTGPVADLGGVETICSDCPNGLSAGVERHFLVVTEAPRNALPFNLTGLIETCERRDPTRSAAASEVSAYFDELWASPQTRGSFGGLGFAEIWVERLDWVVLPREEVFAQIDAAQ